MSKQGTRTRKLTRETIDELSKYVSGGLTNKDACAIVGIHPSSLYKWLQEPRKGLEVDLFDSLENARAQRKAFMIQTITSAAKSGTWQAAAWWLERAYPQEYGKCQRLPERDEKTLDAVRELMRSVTVAADRDAGEPEQD